MIDVGDLTTAHIVDACLRCGLEPRVAPPGLHAVTEGARLAGRVRPVRHVGSVDLYLEAFASAEAGDVLVVDNGGRSDEACVGDLVVIEAREAGLAGIVIWGLHRDTVDIRTIGLPVFSLGATPVGPTRLDPRPNDALTAGWLGEVEVTAADVVVGDADGVIVVEAARLDEVLEAARGIRDTERTQAHAIANGVSLRDQVRFGDYLAARERNPDLTFREHLRAVGGEIEV